MKLGISLSGGGVKGAAHIGVLKALEEEKINIEYISGTSAGSIVAVLYASGFSTDEIYELFKEYGKKIKYIDFKNVFRFAIGAITRGKFVINGLNSGKIIEKLINLNCSKKQIYNIKDIKRPLLIPSVDLHTGEIYIFSSLEKRNVYSDKIRYINDINIGKAVRCSCSYPGVFSPCKYNETELIDGGIRENVPWRETKKLGADKVLSVVFESEIREKCCDNIIDVISNSINILCHELSNYELIGADYLLKIKSGNIKLLDTKKIEELYNIGYKQTKEKIVDIKSRFFIENKK